MARQFEHPLGATMAEVGAPGAATATVAAPLGCACHPHERSEDGMFGDVDPAIRMRMELVARASASPETALAFVIALLVEGDERRDVIVEAINGNELLREQWHRAWNALRR